MTGDLGRPGGLAEGALRRLPAPGLPLGAEGPSNRIRIDAHGAPGEPDGARSSAAIRARTSGLTIETGPNLVWEPGPGLALQAPLTFTTGVPIRARIEQLLAALLRASTEVREEQQDNYARLAPRLCNHRLPGFPHSTD